MQCFFLGGRGCMKGGKGERDYLRVGEGSCYRNYKVF